MDLSRIDAVLDRAAADGRFALLEHEVYEVLDAMGCRVPRWVYVPRGEAPAPDRLATLGGERVMLKVVAPAVAHKTDVGGVRAAANDPATLPSAIERLCADVATHLVPETGSRSGSTSAGGPDRGAAPDAPAGIRGVLVVEQVSLDGEGAGAEVIVALRQSREFGPVITMGVGGVDTELLAESLRPGVAAVTASATMLDADGLLAACRSTLAYRRLAGLTRAGGRLVGDARIAELLGAFRALGLRFGDGPGPGWTVTELEVNPFGASRGELVALDGLLQFRSRAAPAGARPPASILTMLAPRSIAIIGVSAKGMNLGRTILANTLAAGFDPAQLSVIRADCPEIDGVRCVPSIPGLPERVDLFVVALGADQVPAVVDELVEHDRAVGVIVIPGGMGEKEGGSTVEARLRSALERARSRGLPMVVNGGNCLGIVSRPGRYDTLFIPRGKLPIAGDGGSGVALVSQSGAFMITRLSRLPWLSPRYAISTGNQVDLTIGDYVQCLAGDAAVRTFAVYVEGFRDGDGRAFAQAVREVTSEGRDVIFYKAGRTDEGKRATAGHTASIAGDHDICTSIVEAAGGHVARTFDEFLGLLKLSAMLGGRAWRGRRLGALSNAGYEAVGIADALRGEGWHLELAELGAGTRASLRAALARGRADSLVDVHNPLDLTPMADDDVHHDAVRALLADPAVDVVLCATIPLTGAMATLPAEIAATGGLPARLGRLASGTDTPIVVSLDSGPLFDPLADAVEAQGIPVFRAADAAIATIGRYLETRLRVRAARV